MQELMTNDERLVLRLTRQTPGLSQPEIARRLRKNQGTISRILASAERKFEALKRVCREAGGDPSEVDTMLARMDETPVPAASRA